MDKNILKFWGNLFTSAADHQELMDEMHRWMGKDSAASSDFQQILQKLYTPNVDTDAGTKFTEMTDLAADELKKRLNDFFSLINVVPRNEHVQLIKKYEAIKKVVKEQEETIKHLKILLEEKKGETPRTVKNFEDMMKTQSDQFQSLMENFGKFYSGTSNPSEDEDKKS